MDTPLNLNGINQAATAAKSLTGMGIQRIYASPMQRARKTAEIIAEALSVPIEFRNALREKDFGEMQGLRPEEIELRFGEALKRVRYSLDIAPAGGETNADVMHRLRPVISEIEKLDQQVLVVTHGAVARLLFKMLSSPTDEEFGNFSIENCQVMAFTSDNRGCYECRFIRTTAEECC